MKKILLKFINPYHLFKAWRYKRASSEFDKSTFDLELYLYSKILRNDMLHYGYFENTEIESDSISLKDVEDAQVKYAQNIIDHITNKDGLILDVGCGMGGLANMLTENDLKAEALTPNKNQIAHIKHKYPHIPCYQLRFENYETNKKYGTVINSESFQYIPLDIAFEKVGKMIEPGGTWIVVDYFRLHGRGINISSGLLEDFIKKADEDNWEIVYQQDITRNVLPTIKLASMYAERFLLPVKHFAFEKIRFKQPFLYYFVRDLKEKVDFKLTKELAAVDPVKFVDEKKYMFFVLRKK